MRRAVSPRRLELQLDLACRVALHPLIGERWAGNVTTQPLQGLSLPGTTTHRRMQAETLQVGA